MYSGGVSISAVHFGYSGHLGPGLSVHYIRMSTICEVSSICEVKGNTFCTGLIDIKTNKGVHLHSLFLYKTMWLWFYRERVNASVHPYSFYLLRLCVF